MDDIAICIALADELTELYKDHGVEEMRTQMHDLMESVVETLEQVNESPQPVRARVLADPALRTVRDTLQEMVDQTHTIRNREKSWCARLCCLCFCRTCCACCSRCCCRCCRRCWRWCCCCCCYDPDAVHNLLLVLAEGNRALGLAADEAATAYEDELLEKLQSLETMIDELDDSSPEGDKKLLEAVESLQQHVADLPGGSSSEDGGSSASVAPDSSSSSPAAQHRATVDALVRRAREANSSGQSGQLSALRSETKALTQSLRQGARGRSESVRQASSTRRSRQQRLVDNHTGGSSSSSSGGHSGGSHTQDHRTIELQNDVRRMEAESTRLRSEMDAVRVKYSKCPACGATHA